MPITRCAAETTLFPGLAGLPPDALALFGGEADFYASLGWYETLVATALPPDAYPCFALTRLDGRAVAVWPLLRQPDGALRSLTAPYTCLYGPLLAAGLPDAALSETGRSFASHPAIRSGVRLEALDGEAEAWALLRRGFRRAGLLILRFEHFGNWHEPVAGLDWAAYLAARPGALRETLRRRSAKLLADPTTRIEMLAHPDEIEPGIDAFEAIYRRSWKQPEPHPAFNAACIRLAARQGVLRLAVLRRDGTPVAVQLWVVLDGRAAVLKLAHDEAHRAVSPGTVLTGWVIGRLLATEAITELDFGRGDDDYKKAWATRRRPRLGMVLASPKTMRGWLQAIRHTAGLGRRKMQKILTDINAMARGGGG